MILNLVLLAALAAPIASSPTPAAPPAPVTTSPAASAEPVVQPIWLAGPSQAMMMNCTTGYLTDPTFTGESIVMGCIVQPDGSLGQCQVKETKRAQAAGVQDVAVCASGGFRIGPVDKLGKPTAGRPVLLPLAIATLADDPAAAGATTPPAAKNP